MIFAKKQSDNMAERALARVEEEYNCEISAEVRSKKPFEVIFTAVRREGVVKVWQINAPTVNEVNYDPMFQWLAQEDIVWPRC